MNAINELKNEHKAIKTTLEIMGKIIEKMSMAGEAEAIGHLGQLIEFFQIFADKCHHGKEEEVLFPALMKLGMSKNGGPIGVMLAEHNEGREYIRNLKIDLDLLTKKDPQAYDRIVENAKNYISLLRRHIEKEDTVLFRIADNNLSSEEQSDIYEKFTKIEMEKIGPGKHEELHDLLNQLKIIYL